MARYRISTSSKNYTTDGPIATQDGWLYFNTPPLPSLKQWAIGVPIGQVLSVIDTQPQSPVVVNDEQEIEDEDESLLDEEVE